MDGRPQVFPKTSHQYHPHFAMETSPPSSPLANSLDCKEFLPFLGELTASLAWHSYTHVRTSLENFVFDQGCISKSKLAFYVEFRLKYVF